MTLKAEPSWCYLDGNKKWKGQLNPIPQFFTSFFFLKKNNAASQGMQFICEQQEEFPTQNTMVSDYKQLITPRIL